MAKEVNFDGLVGPTHHYGGLSFGNVASLNNRHSIAYPKKAALQGLAKMNFMLNLGLPQAVLPPHERPALDVLRQHGYTGSPEQILNRVWKRDKALLCDCSSASAMWTANAATVTPSVDASDGRVHLTVANLKTLRHRSLEAATTYRILKTVFHDEKTFMVHAPLAGEADLGMSDEGAANHTRLCASHGGRGLHLFVFGNQKRKEAIYPARQSREASDTIAKQHQIGSEQFLLVEQNPRAIDAGVFHNDVIAVGNESMLLYHEDAFAGGQAVFKQMEKRYADLTGSVLNGVCVQRDALSLADAVQTYLFNSQLVTLPGTGKMVLIAPVECRENEEALRVIERLVSDSNNPIAGVHFLDLRQSMRNGGGPACLRLRVVLNEREMKAMNARVLLTEERYHHLVRLVERHYRDTLSLDDLRDAALYEESCCFLDELTEVLDLGSVYYFQR